MELWQAGKMIPYSWWKTGRRLWRQARKLFLGVDMSGIIGICFFDGRPMDRADLERMADKIAHRGPDASGIWLEGSVGLGHLMLRTTPESFHEQLPLANRSGSLVITADARIDNRQELLATLNFPNLAKSEITDSLLILGAYEKWGEACPEKLLGDFAFAVWDGRRQQLFCARDHMGAKPFYYFFSPRTFAFASEIKAILCLEDVPRRVNDDMIEFHLDPWHNEDQTGTSYCDIFRLPPGHLMRVDSRGATVRRYWSLTPPPDAPYRSDSEWAEAFLEVLTEALRCRLRGADPAGFLLSGGIDSCSIACLARQMAGAAGGPRLATFSVVDDNPDLCLEGSYIKEVLKLGGFDPHQVRASEVENFFDDFEYCLQHQDEPFEANSHFAFRIGYRIAQKQGCRVVLDGAGGDIIVAASENCLAFHVKSRQWKSVAREVAGLSGRLRRSAPWVLCRYGLLPLAPAWVFRTLWRLRPLVNPEWRGLSPFINPEFAKQRGLEDRLLADWTTWSKIPPTLQEERLRYFNLNFNPSGLENYNKAAAVFSVEPRHPFLDKRLVEFSLTLPLEQRSSNGWNKIILRQAMAGLLPEKVRWRSDRGTVIPLATKVYRWGRKLIHPVKNELHILEKYVNLNYFNELYKKYEKDEDWRDGEMLWTITSLYSWLKRINP